VAGACEEQPVAVRRSVTELLAARPGVTGLVVHNEAAVEHVLAALRDLGRRVPADVSVVAICPDELAECADPPLTSVQIPAAEVGVRAVDLLMRKLTGAQVPGSTLLPPVLTARASTVHR
jgi:DNA-binding LacI/PurR family transcriptional regulator